MSRSGQLIAIHDNLIREMIESDLYKIDLCGRVYTRIARTGKVFKDPNRWREAGGLDKDGYCVIRFKGKKLRRARIIYMKHSGKRTFSDLIINHIDEDRQNDSIGNLELITQANNIRHRFNK